MLDDVLRAARAATDQAPPVGDPAYRRFVGALGEVVERNWDQIEEANARDVATGRDRGLPEPLLRRIRFTAEQRPRVTALTTAVADELARGLPADREYAGIAGARARRVRRPLGVLLMIYEARPTVTLDAAVLPICAGNAVLLRGGTEIAATNAVLGDLLGQALAEAGLPGGLAQVLTDVDRAGLRELLHRDDAVDVLLPRGGPSLVDWCRATSRIPMIVGGGGVNHQYVHADADPDLAVRLVLDGKLPEPEGCTALEMALLHDGVADQFLRMLAKHADAPDVRALTLRVDDALADRVPPELAEALPVEPLTAADDGREFLRPTLAVRAVAGLDAAVAHIARHGSGHTEGIVTGSPQVADEFCRRVDAAAVVVNGSVRLHDGPSLGVGTEIAISTGRLHVRGPVTLGDLTTWSWRVDGNGAVRFRTR
ncbi:glutamate-5-semialdehyde dehydrogenase [Micromonospora psammae]|uniref:glutamate-5-semialdehyde dehydrogenase n=1 Tax=Micromonospora sp. CPCC 205556 TaxID=3122398 RepID=UPI002FF2AF5E